MAADQPITIRPLQASDEEGWRALWRGYQVFYKADLRADEARLFAALLAARPGEDGPFALLAVSVDEEGRERPVGLAHYLFHRSTWSPAPRCYLNDLYTDGRTRGQGVGAALIEAVAGQAGARGCEQVYWLTEVDNAPARRLYDRVARLSNFIRYVRPL